MLNHPTPIGAQEHAVYPLTEYALGERSMDESVTSVEAQPDEPPSSETMRAPFGKGGCVSHPVVAMGSQ